MSFDQPHGSATLPESPAPARRRRGRKVTAILGPGRSVTLAGEDLSFTGVISMLEDLLARAKRAKGQSIQLCTFLRILADQNGAAE